MLKSKRVVSLDIASMVAGAKYRGDFEERIKKCLEEVKKAGDVILFIDEVHKLNNYGRQARGTKGSSGAMNALKESLARGKAKIIAATTDYEYQGNIAQDLALSEDSILLC